MPQARPRQRVGRRFLVFVLCGGINTAVTYLLYLLLMRLVHYQVAYLAACLVGIALAYVVNLRVVFGSQSSAGKILRYPLVYLGLYVFGAAQLYLYVDLLHFSATLAPLLVVAVQAPVSYLLNKKVLSGDPEESAPGA